MKGKDKTIQRAGLFSLRPVFGRLEAVPHQCITIKYNVKKFIILQDTPDAAEEERARRDLPGSGGVWDCCEWRPENIKTKGQILV